MTWTNPAENMIERNPGTRVQNILDMYSSYLEEAVNFGTNLLLWKAEEYKDESPVSDLFFRNFLDLLDSLSILVGHGSREGSVIILRSVFEVNLSIHFICEKHTDLRAYSFLVVDTINQLNEIDRADRGTPRGKEVRANILKEGLIKNFDEKYNKEESEKEMAELKEYLTCPDFVKVIEEYERVKAVKKGKPVKWYNLFDGKDSIELLAKSLNKHTFYEILYRRWSTAVHGVNVIRDKIIETEAGEMHLRALREPTGLMFVTKMACNFAINTFGYYVLSRHAKRIDEYKAWEDKFAKRYSADLDHEYITFKRSL